MMQLLHPQPKSVINYLASKVASREIKMQEIKMQDIKEFQEWVESNPIVGEYSWFIRFTNFTIVGQGNLVRSILEYGHTPIGDEIKFKRI